MILNLICEDSLMRAIARLTGVSSNTVAKLLIDAGKACAEHHDENARNVKAARVQCDEIWPFTYAKQKNVAAAKAALTEVGDTWSWTTIDSDSKLLVSWLVDGRNADYANAFMQDVAERLANRAQLTAYDHASYLEAVEGTFGIDVDHTGCEPSMGNWSRLWFATRCGPVPLQRRNMRWCKATTRCAASPIRST